MYQDQLRHQYLREANYCGRFKAWQLAAMFMGFVLMLAGGLPLLTLHLIPWLCRLVGVL